MKRFTGYWLMQYDDGFAINCLQFENDENF